MATGWGARLRAEMQNYATNKTPAASPTTPFAGLSEANPGDQGATNDEPTSAGGYAAKAITWATTTQPADDASAVASNSVAITWGPSSAAWSSGADPLSYVGIWNHLTTRTNAVYLGRAAISVPQAVNAAGITLTIAIGGLTMGCISA